MQPYPRRSSKEPPDHGRLRTPPAPIDRALTRRFRISSTWLFILPAILLGAALERGANSAQSPCPVGAAAEIHYGPGEDLERIDVALIREATKQIDVAAYVLTDSTIVEPLREASARGMKVRVWRDASQAARLSAFDVEAQLGGRVQGLELQSSRPGGELMHLKGYCVDHRLLRTGSANFSRSGETRQDDDLVALRGESICAEFDAKFDKAWAKS
jgi:phosphatidylserine/phosphatidylglycerophosphate/cardiolipin synthase-like enzyme